MNTRFQRSVMLPTIAGCALTLAARNTFGLGSDYSNGTTVNQPAWPTGMSALVNSTNRVAGFFVNAEDVFFFSGTASDFSEFLGDYSKIQNIESHRLIFHSGAGEAKSPWEKSGRPCDWKLYGSPKGWLNLGKMSAKGTNSSEASRAAVNETNYVLEVHFWTGGKIQLDQLIVPKNIEFAGDCFKNFDTITNGMTRAEVERRLKMDGGLQGVSPVRFLDPACPGFKVNVEFDFKRNAADQGRAIWGKDDKVIRVSKPYIEQPFLD